MGIRTNKTCSAQATFCVHKECSAAQAMYEIRRAAYWRGSPAPASIVALCDFV